MFLRTNMNTNTKIIMTVKHLVFVMLVFACSAAKAEEKSGESVEEEPVTIVTPPWSMESFQNVDDVNNSTLTISDSPKPSTGPLTDLVNQSPNLHQTPNLNIKINDEVNPSTEKIPSSSTSKESQQINTGESPKNNNISIPQQITPINRELIESRKNKRHTEAETNNSTRSTEEFVDLNRTSPSGIDPGNPPKVDDKKEDHEGKEKTNLSPTAEKLNPTYSEALKDKGETVTGQGNKNINVNNIEQGQESSTISTNTPLAKDIEIANNNKRNNSFKANARNADGNSDQKKSIKTTSKSVGSRSKSKPSGVAQGRQASEAECQETNAEKDENQGVASNNVPGAKSQATELIQIPKIQGAESNVLPQIKYVNVTANVSSSTETNSVNAIATTVLFTDKNNHGKNLSTSKPVNSSMQPLNNTNNGQNSTNPSRKINWKKTFEIIGRLLGVATVIGGAFYLVYSVT